MIQWYFNHQSRVGSEKAAIADLAIEADWLENIAWQFDGVFGLQLVFDICLPHGTFHLALSYPATFPNSVPSIRPIDGARLSTHQYANGDLCLEIRPDNWRPEFTGADVIQSAYNLLEAETPDATGKVVPALSAHEFPATMALRHTVSRFHLTPAVKIALRDEAPHEAQGNLRLEWNEGGFFVGHLSGLKKDDWSWSNTEIPRALSDSFAGYDLIVKRSAKSHAAFNGVVTLEQLRELLDGELTSDEASQHFLVIPADGNPVLLQKYAGKSDLIRYKIIFSPLETGVRTGTVYEALSNIRVGIVGCGSVGSKVAVSLARSGLGRFDLVDGDILLAGNLERHDADWRDVGFHKVDGVKRRIHAVNPGAVVNVRRYFFGSQVSATEAASVTGELSECDIVIDATANDTVFNHLTALILQAGKSLLWGGIYAGGIGGFMARSRPEKDPHPQHIRQAMLDYYGTIDEAPPMPAKDGYDGQVDDEVFVATDADISTLSNHMTKLALDTVLNVEPSEYEAQVYLIGLKYGWIFKSPFDVHALPVDAPLRVQSTMVDSCSDQADFLQTIFNNKLDEITNSQNDK